MELLKFLPAFIVYIGLAILCQSMHKKKGYTGLAGFFWGLFFGPFGVAVIVLEKTKAEKDASTKKELPLFVWVLIVLAILFALLGIYLFISLKLKRFLKLKNKALNLVFLYIFVKILFYNINFEVFLARL